MDFNGLHLEPGDELLRRDLHAVVGGQQQSGISPSSSFPVVLLFSNPSAGEEHGYFDGWQDDGFFHYAGEGQRGDQLMRRGNKRIRNHREDQRSLHLFLGVSKGRPVRYVGEFSYVDHYLTDAKDSDGELREVIMFRLRPENGGGRLPESLAATTRASLSRPETTKVLDVPTEIHEAERFYYARSESLTEAERRESGLVKEFEHYMRGLGVLFTRKRIQVAGELKPLFCDLYDPGANVLVEAKGTASRQAFRMAIGQLYDYGRFIEPRPKLAVLLPSEPRPDLRSLAREAGINVIFRNEGGGFEGLVEVGYP